jgi:selenocysteine lyase/cysteine desulfurase
MELPGCSTTGPDDEHATGLTAVVLENWEPREIVEALWEGWRIAARAVAHPPAVRLSTTIFNTEEEVDQVVEALRELVRRRS